MKYYHCVGLKTTPSRKTLLKRCPNSAKTLTPKNPNSREITRKMKADFSTTDLIHIQVLLASMTCSSMSFKKINIERRST
jgi:hypothetical protein